MEELYGRLDREKAKWQLSSIFYLMKFMFYYYFVKKKKMLFGVFDALSNNAAQVDRIRSLVDDKYRAQSAQFEQSGPKTKTKNSQEKKKKKKKKPVTWRSDQYSASSSILSIKFHSKLLHLNWNSLQKWLQNYRYLQE